MFVVEKAPSLSTLAFLERLGCKEKFSTQSAASARINELLAQRDTAKVASEQQHKALNALGGKALPGATHREISKVIALLSAVEIVDLTGTKKDRAAALEALLVAVREQYQARYSMRVIASRETPEPKDEPSTTEDVPF